MKIEWIFAIDSTNSFALNDGRYLPKIGLGTYKLQNATEVMMAIDSALEIGYRLIDTAKRYGNEKQIGDALMVR
jgi:diketogulonate reductase-like aldo/keto reductase